MANPPSTKVSVKGKITWKEYMDKRRSSGGGKSGGKSDGKKK